MKLLIASQNGHKIKEIKEYFKDFKIEVLSLRDVDFDFDIEEKESTFSGNAIAKAKTIQSFYPQMTILADDSGICIKALNQQPGVHSARFLGHNTADAIKNREVLKLLDGVHDRQAMFVCAMVLLTPHDLFLTQQVVYGNISHEPLGDGTFGYDPIFIPEGHHLTFAQDLQYKNQVSHRVKALNEVVRYVRYLTK